MKITCEKCSRLVIEGRRKNSDRNGKIIFDTTGEDKKARKPMGTILTNNSSEPKNWTGMCSECQSLNALGRRRKKYEEK